MAPESVASEQSTHTGVLLLPGVAGMTFIRQPLAFEITGSSHTWFKCRAMTFHRYWPWTEHDRSAIG